MRADGLACTKDEQCEVACVSGKCAPRAACGAGGLGAACYETGNCAGELICAAGVHHCVKAKAAGERCLVRALECDEGLYCQTGSHVDLDNPAGICQPLKANGAACVGYDECESGQCNAENKCEAVAMCGEGEQRVRNAREIAPGRIIDGLVGFTRYAR